MVYFGSCAYSLSWSESDEKIYLLSYICTLNMKLGYLSLLAEKLVVIVHFLYRPYKQC